MEDMLLRASFGEDREIWISDVSRDTFEANEIDDLGTDFGYFLMTGKRSPGGQGARILAKAASAQAAIELFGMLTSRTKRCAVLADEPTIPSGTSIAQFPSVHESAAARRKVAPKTKAKPRQKSKKTRATRKPSHVAASSR